MGYKENAEIVKKYLDANDWHYDIEDYGTAVSFSGDVDGGTSVYSSFHFKLLVENDDVVNFAALPIGAGEKKSEIAEYITRVNFPLKRGRMVMDYRDGEIGFRLSVPIAALKQDTDEVLQEVLCLPGVMLSQYGDGVAKIHFGGIDPKTAYEQCGVNAH